MYETKAGQPEVIEPFQVQALYVLINVMIEYQFSGYHGYNSAMSKSFTGRGDNGTTAALGSGRIRKDDAQPEAFGTVDELSAVLSVARTHCTDPLVLKAVIEIQRDLFHLMSELAAAPEVQAEYRHIDPDRVAWLEEEISRVENLVEIPETFILSGSQPAASAFDLARTITRRAERRVVTLFFADRVINQELLRYLNRLSSLLFLYVLLESTRDGSPIIHVNQEPLS
ncbi:MAG: cob(I)yrinic acid a,c-diamide adenosyltransferase [Anaerolineales bacterium]|nr:cob(I)yrinic acid a,c-diamide adenosyltransferase [Anaerolineales bacterium]